MMSNDMMPKSFPSSLFILNQPTLTDTQQ